MSNVINVFLQNFVASMVAVLLTGLLAWSVIDSTTTGSSDQISVRNQA
jgi:ABC-type polysaccharide/polyol phosphate export permease